MDVAAYLNRIGATPSDPLDVLVDRHLHAVPFETLSIHLGEPIDLDPDALVDKIVTRRRGGFCHELNGAFAALLGALGYDVALLGARVGNPQEGFGPVLDHVALRVTGPDGDGPWLVDVGFGSFGVGPVPFDDDAALRAAAHGDLDVLGPDGTVGYRVELRARRRVDFEAQAWWQATSPTAPFARGPVCSLPVDGGRITLAGRTLTTTGADDGRDEHQLTDAEALAALRDRFGIVLERLPTPTRGALVLGAAASARDQAWRVGALWPARD